MDNSPADIPLKRAILSIVLSTFLLSGSCLLSLLYYQHIREKQRRDPAYQIVAIVQTSPDSEGLKTAHLAELLGLSVDHPRNLYSFSTKEAVQNLLQLPVIKEAHIRKIRPGVIHVDYTLRKPIAYFADYANTAIDAEGVLFPFKPFFTPKRLPEIYTGEEVEGIWGATVNSKGKKLAFDLLSLAPDYCDEMSSISRIDVSKAFALSDGQRQIVIALEDRIARVVDGKSVLCIYPRLLRLRPDNCRRQLANYPALRSYLRKKDRAAPPSDNGVVVQAKATIIDLRLSELAFFVAEP